MQGAQTPLFGMSGADVSRISSRALHLDLDPIGRTQFKVSLDDRTGEIVHLLERLLFAIVKVGLPMPRGVATGACGAKDEELRIGGPLVFLHIASMFTVGGPEIFESENVIVHVMNFDPRFIEWRTMFADRGHASSQFLIRRCDARAFPLRLMGASQQGSHDQEGKEDAHTELRPG